MTPDPMDPEDDDLEPRLDDAVVEDEQEIGEAIDAFIVGNSIAQDRLHEIVSQQDHLRRMLDPDGWAYVLLVDELITARWAFLTIEIARWAYAEGRRNGSASPRE